MRVLPVLDLKGGQVVRGIAGRRDDYRPIVSRLVSSSNPVEVALAFRDHFGLTELYVADLDAIAGAELAVLTYVRLQAHGFRLWVDAGVRTSYRASELEAHGVEGLILALETIPGPDALTMLGAMHPERVVFSLDLKGGKPLGDVSRWPAPDAWSIAAEAVRREMKRLIVLDLERVGVYEGPAAEALSLRLARTYPDVEVLVGGGVRGVEDLRRLKTGGVRGALVASALHDGRLSREDLLSLRA